MLRNRKREEALNWVLPVTKWFVLFGAIATVCIGYIWQQNSIYKLGDDIKRCEQQLEALRKRHSVLVDQIARLKSPQVIETKCRTWNLGLGVPKESQIVRVTDPMLYPTTVVQENRSSFVPRREIASNQRAPMGGIEVQN